MKSISNLNVGRLAAKNKVSYFHQPVSIGAKGGNYGGVYRFDEIIPLIPAISWIVFTEQIIIGKVFLVHTHFEAQAFSKTQNGFQNDTSKLALLANEVVAYRNQPIRG